MRFETWVPRPRLRPPSRPVPERHHPLSAEWAFGSPAHTDAELASAPEEARLEADRVLGQIVAPRLRTGGSTGGACRLALASPEGSTGLELGQ